MKIIVKKVEKLHSPSSASGVEYINGLYYIIGDDANALFILDENLKVKKIIPFYQEKPVQEHIPKKEKPDFECMSFVYVQEVPHILIMGSGSKPKRKIAFLYNLVTEEMQKLDYVGFYDNLEKDNVFTLGAELNLEALCCTNEYVYLFQRGNNAEKNSFLRFLVQKIYNPDEYEIFYSKLQGIGKGKAGFSGACHVLEWNGILFTTSVELTQDAYNDGEVLGSTVGFIQNHSVKENVVVTYPDGKPYIAKIESISVKKMLNTNTLLAVAVTDADGKESEIVELEITR
jgi:hypothetical protein